MPLSTNLPTNYSDGSGGHTDAHNSTNARVNLIASEVNTHEGATDPHGDRAYTDTQIATRQPLDADLTALAGLGDGNPRRVSGTWSMRSDAALASALGVAGGGGGGTGGVDPTDVGYDLILLMGQSNMAGWASDANYTRFDVTDPRVSQYGAIGSSGGVASIISQAVEPLAFPDTTVPGIGPGVHFARWYLCAVEPNRRVLLVPAAVGGTALSSNSTNAWRYGTSGGLTAKAITQAQAALTAAGGNARITAVLWVQGEADCDAGTTGPTYRTDLDALITGLRTSLGAPTLPFVIGQMVPEGYPAGVGAAIDAVQADTPNRLDYTGYAAGPTGNPDVLHYNAAHQRSLARNMFNAWLVAKDHVAGGTPTLTNTILPTISGTATTGQSLTASNGTWSATPDSFTYQWKRAGSNISGATASTYVLQVADEGQSITVTVTASKAGYTSNSATSSPVTPTGGQTLTNTSLPTITGTPTEGQALSAGNGSWSAVPDSYTYQWKRSGSNISGATASTYTLVTADVGSTITVAVTAIKSGYTSGSATSNPTGTISAASGVTETWTGTTGASWPAAWTIDYGTGSIQANRGRLTGFSGGIGRTRQTAMSAITGNFDITVTASAGGPNTMIGMGDTWNPFDVYPQNGYVMEFQASASTAGFGWIYLRNGGSRTTLANTSSALGTTAGPNGYKVRFQRTGSTVRMRVWSDGASEPGTWDLSATDSTVTAALTFYLAFSGNDTVSVDFDDLAIS